MNVPREQIYNALFGLAQSAFAAGSGFGIMSRQPQLWTNVKPGDFPAFFQWEVSEKADQVTFGLTRWEAKVKWMVFVQPSQNYSDVVTARMDPYLDALEKALEPDAGGKQTLGGLVANVWVDGTVLKDVGVLSSTAGFMMPLTIITGQ